jgi:hypothetical protein
MRILSVIPVTLPAANQTLAATLHLVVFVMLRRHIVEQARVRVLMDIHSHTRRMAHDNDSIALIVTR